MRKQSIYAIIIIVIILVLSVIFISLQKTTDKKAENNDRDTEEILEPEELIHIKHQYKNGIHTFAGDIIVDSDCSDRLDSKIIDSDEGPTLVFETVRNNPEAECVKEPFKVYPYKLFHTSGETTVYRATLNGVPVRLNVYEVSPDEDIDEVDLFIKG